jgi:hypothetical protein
VKSFAVALLVVAAYALLVAWMMWPFPAHLATHLPDTHFGCRYDYLQATWAVAYETHAITTEPSRFLEGNIYHPARHALAYGVTGFGMLPYFAPLFVLTQNPALAMNVAFLASIIFTAGALHLVVRQWTGSHAGGAVAGLTLLSTRWVLWDWLPVAPTYAVLQYFPLIVFLASTPIRGLAAAGGLLVLVVLQCLTDQVYVAPAVLLPLGVIAVARLSRSTTRRAGLRLSAVLALAVVLLVPAYVGYLSVRAANPRLARQSVWSVAPDPMPAAVAPFAHRGLLLMPPASLLTWFRSGPMGVPLTALVLIALGGACFWVRERRGGEASARAVWVHGAYWVMAGALMGLPPAVQWGGETLALPHLTESIFGPPLFTVFRQPRRFGVAGLMGLALLAGAATAACARALKRPWARVSGAFVLAAVLGMMHLEYRGGLGNWAPLPRSYPLDEAIEGDSAVVRALRQPGGPVLEVPVQGTAHLPHARAMYRSIFHWRPLLNGYGSYWPVGFPERMALAGRLPAPDALDALRRETGLAAIVVHASPGNPEVGAWRLIAERGGREDLCLVARDGHDLLFAVRDKGETCPETDGRR